MTRLAKPALVAFIVATPACAIAQTGADLLKKEGCVACHAIDKKVLAEGDELGDVDDGIPFESAVAFTQHHVAWRCR